MGKKQRKMEKKAKQQSNLPFVSVCTPTFNRRPFIPYIIKCFESQDYPRDKLEWIIIDDGTDKIEDLVADLPYVKYFKYDEKMRLGKKRNLMHEKSKGEIIVYMDDDDFYPPDRVSHAVDRLRKNNNALCAGSSEIYIWFKHIKKMYQFGPYGPKHATAGTFAFKRELLKQTSYDENASLAEEKHFLKNYTIPFVQLDPLKTILVFSHIHNTFDKKMLLENGESSVMKVSKKPVDLFIKNTELKDFFMNKVDDILKEYEPGDPKHKPDVLKQTKEIKEERERRNREAMIKQLEQCTDKIVLKDNGQIKVMSVNDAQKLIQQQHDLIEHIKKTQCFECKNKSNVIPLDD